MKTDFKQINAAALSSIDAVLSRWLTDGRGEDVIAGTHTEYCVFPETFKREVCDGFDYRVVCKLLVKRECLVTEEINGKVSYTRKERLPGGEGNMRCFRITHKLFEGGGDE